jgi:hypothetical protein
MRKIGVHLENILIRAFESPIKSRQIGAGEAFLIFALQDKEPRSIFRPAFKKPGVPSPE